MLNGIRVLVTAAVVGSSSLIGAGGAVATASEPTGTLYFLDGNDVVSMPAAGGAVTRQPIAIEEPEYFRATGLAVSGNDIYFTTSEHTPETWAGRLKTVPIGGGTPTTLVTGLSPMVQSPGLLELSGDVLFAAVYNYLVPLPVTGGQAPEPLPGPGFEVRALEAVGDTLFVGASSSSEGMIYSTPTSGGDFTYLANVNFMVAGMAVDDDTIYLATNRFGPTNGFSIMKMPRTGGALSLVTEIDGFPTSMAVGRGQLYITAFGQTGTGRDGIVLSVPTSGGSPRTLASGLTDRIHEIEIVDADGGAEEPSTPVPCTGSIGSSILCGLLGS